MLQFTCFAADSSKLASIPSCTSGSNELCQSSAEKNLSIPKHVKTKYKDPHGAIVTGDVLGLVELSEDGLGQNLAKFHTHLVLVIVSGWRILERRNLPTKRVDSPDDTLDENFVLVKSDQGACNDTDQ